MMPLMTLVCFGASQDGDGARMESVTWRPSSVFPGGFPGAHLDFGCGDAGQWTHVGIPEQIQTGLRFGGEPLHQLHWDWRQRLSSEGYQTRVFAIRTELCWLKWKLADLGMKWMCKWSMLLCLCQIFEVRMVSRTPVTRWLDRLVRARFLRIIPVEFRHTFYLRVEVLGCRGGTAAACCCFFFSFHCFSETWVNQVTRS